jgi:NADH-quinone oxidoreductase subunit N
VAIAVVGHAGRDDDRDGAGFGWTHPVLAVAMTVFLVSLVGLPPTAGFLGKWYLFSALVKSGSAVGWLLAIAAIVNTVVSLYYYVGLVRRMWLDRPAAGQLRVRAGTLAGGAILALAALVAYPFGYGERVLAGARNAARQWSSIGGGRTR